MSIANVLGRRVRAEEVEIFRWEVILGLTVLKGRGPDHEGGCQADHVD